MLTENICMAKQDFYCGWQVGLQSNGVLFFFFFLLHIHAAVKVKILLGKFSCIARKVPSNENQYTPYCCCTAGVFCAVSSQNKQVVLMQCDTLTGRLSKKVRQTFLGHFNNPSRATIRTETTWSDNLELSFKTVTTL